MRLTTLIIFSLLKLTVRAQDKTDYTHYNKLIDIKGTEYVIATASNYGKGFSNNGKYLLFINTKLVNISKLTFLKTHTLTKLSKSKLTN